MKLFSGLRIVGMSAAVAASFSYGGPRVGVAIMLLALEIEVIGFYAVFSARQAEQRVKKLEQQLEILNTVVTEQLADTVRMLVALAQSAREGKARAGQPVSEVDRPA